ncbi:MAG: hypothetical protein ACM3MG_02355 [Bacillota bacterium]
MNPTLHFGFTTLLELLKISALTFGAGFILHHFSAWLRRSLSENLGVHAFNLMFAPGIMIHEISHALAAFIFLHEVVDLKLFDWKAKDGSHGHVVSRPRSLPMVFKIWIKMGDLFIGIAPLVLGPAICAALFYYLIPGGKSFIHSPRFTNFPSFSWTLMGWFYFTIAVLAQMELSEADLKGAWKGFFWIALCTFISSLIYFNLLRH